jgi:hypothetical protein
MRIFRTGFEFVLGVLLAVGTPAAKAASISVSGDFQAVTLMPWTAFTTANGTIDGGPNIVSFDTGSGASLAAEFSVGEVTYTGLPEGGGIDRSFTLSSGGTFEFFTSIASQNLYTLPNADAGTFSILVDGAMLASDSLGGFTYPCTGGCNQMITGALSGSVVLTPGVHTFEVLITRDFQCCGDVEQYVDDISLTAAVPEPGTFATVALVGLALYLKVRNREAGSRRAAVLTKLAFGINAPSIKTYLTPRSISKWYLARL